MKKRRYWILGSIGVLLVGIIAAAAVLLETQAGLHWAVQFAEQHSGGVLQIGQAEGRLAGPFTLKNIRVNVSGTVIRAQRLNIDWHPSGLLLGNVDIKRLSGSRISVQSKSGGKSSTAGPVALPKRVNLPVSIHITEVRLNDVSWQDSKQSVHLNALNFSLEASKKRIRISRLRAQGQKLDATGTLQVQPRNRWNVSARLYSRLHLAGYPLIVGRTRLHGALHGTLFLQQRLTAPFKGELVARARDLFGELKVKGRLRVAQLDPHRIKEAWPSREIGTDISFDGSLRHFNAQGSMSLAGSREPARSFGLNLDAGLEDTSFRIHHLNVTMRGVPTRLTLRGHIKTRAPYSVQATLAWQSLQWPLTGNKPELYAPSGGLRLSGSIHKWQLELATLLSARGIPGGRWALAAHGNRDTAILDSLSGLWLGGTVSGRGQINLQARQPFSITLRARRLQAAGLVPRIQGHAGFDLTANGHLAPLDTNLRLTALRGQMNGHPLRGKAALAYAGKTLDLKSLEIAVGSNHMRASGRMNNKFNLEWRLDAPQLAALYPDLSGALEGHGYIAGTPGKPHVNADLQARQLGWRSLTIGQGRLKGDLDLAGREKASLTLRIENMEINAFAISRIDVKLSGPASRQRISLDMSSDRGDLALAGTGQLGANGWSGQIVSGEVRPLKHSAFTLDAPAVLRVAGRKIEVGRNCWYDANHAGFCTSVRPNQAGWQAAIDLKSLPLSVANPYLANTVSVTGKAAGTIHAERGSRGLKMTGEVHVGSGSVTRAIGGKSQKFAFLEGGIEASLDHDMARMRLGLILQDGGLLDASLDVPWRKHKTLAGHLQLKASMPDLSGLGALSPYVSHVGGSLFANLDVSGSLESPHFGGELRLTRLQALLPRYGTRFENGNLQLQGEGNSLGLKGEVHDPRKGRLTVDGVLKHENSWRFRIHVKGEHFRAANMPEAHVQVSPDLVVSINGRAISLSGSIEIPEARIQPPHFSGAITPSPDLVIVGENSAPTPKWTLQANLHIKLGEHVHFTGYGLSGRIGGELDLRDSPGKLTTGSGELKILDGQYKAYGQDLTIEHGRLLFSGGPLTNPGLDMRAVRKVGTVTAGLQVSGTLRNPRLDVFSEPPMTQSNALAYLLFGHGIDQTSGSEQSTLNRAANAIGIAGGTLLAKTLGKQVGIDTVSVENASPYSTNANQASLFLGKYLSPRLYVSYGIGLYEPLNLLRIRYTLSRHWALEAESGTISGADILYTIGH